MAWHFDRHDRLEVLAKRASILASHLRNEAFDAPQGSGARARYVARLALVEARARRLRTVASWARRNARELANA